LARQLPPPHTSSGTNRVGISASNMLPPQAGVRMERYLNDVED
jgi:hypothetical protein